MTINGELISTTVEHPFYIKDCGFINAGELQVGNEVVNSNGDILTVEDIGIEIAESSVTVYNFQVENFRTYYVGTIGVLVHNANNYKPRNKPVQSGDLNSVSVQRDANGNATKYIEFGDKGEFVKEVRLTGKEHGGIPRPNVKEPNLNINPNTGEVFQNGYTVRPATPAEITKIN